MDSKEYQLRRELLLQKMENHSIALIFSGVEKSASADEASYFEVNRNFYYLTGITQMHSALLIVKSDDEKKCYLFIDEYDEVREKWWGKRITIEEAKEVSGISNVLLYNTLQGTLELALKEGSCYYGELNNLYLDLEKELKIADDFYTLTLKNRINNDYKHITVLDIYKMIVELRMVKSEAEISEIRKAIHRTSQGLKEIQRGLKPTLYEYQINAIFEYVCKAEFDSTLSFPTIIAAGKNGTTLHYPQQHDQIKDGDLVLCDLGITSNLYCSDITRTYPASGKFNPLQKSIYDIVVATNEAVINYIKPGLSLVDLQKYTTDFLVSECLSKGLIKVPEDIRKYYYHNISHHLGLDTHDPSDREKKLEPGNIITVEPGLYFKEFGIGVRIEDDVLVTPTGSENLSKEIVKDSKEIEKILARR